MISSRTGLSLNEGAHRFSEYRPPEPAAPAGWLEALASPTHPLAHAGGHEVRAQVTPESRMRCKREGCPHPWSGGHLMFCRQHEDEYLDLLDEVRSEPCDDAEGS